MDDEQEEGAAVSVGDATLRHTEIDDYAGGKSGLGKSSLGSAALTAALTLHPCVYVEGVGQASKGVLQQIFGSIGPCSVTLIVDDDDEDGDGEPGQATGAASISYGEAAHAVAAIQKFDGAPFDDGRMSVSASRKAATGSLTKRGRGRNADKLTHHDRQQQLLSQARAEQARTEKDAFATARAAAVAAASRPAGPRPTVLAAQTGGGGLGDESVAKRQKGGAGLPKCCLVAKSSAPSAAAKEAPSANAPAAAPPAAAAAAGSLGLLGAYASDESDDGAGGS